MYITSVELQNFKIHRSLTVNFSNINAIVGANAKGKTSILDAISYGLYGVTGDGALKKELLTNSSALKPGEIPPKNGKVIITFDNKYSIVRDLSNTSTLLDDKGNKITDKSSEIERWLNIPKDMFMTLIYGVQGQMATTFLKFNANQKDFIDNLFAISDYMDPILNTIQEAKKNLEFEYIGLESNRNNKANGEKYITDSLASMGCTTMEELDTKITTLNEQISHFSNMEKIAQMKQYQSSIKSKYDYSLNYKSTTEQDIQHIESSIVELQKSFKDASESIQTSLQIEMTEAMNDSILKQKVNSICDINTWYDNLMSIINAIDVSNMAIYKDKAIEIINYIRKIDTYRQQYMNLISNWNNIKYQLNTNTSNLTNLKGKIEQLEHDSLTLKDQLDVINENLTSIGAEGEGSSIDVYKNLVKQQSILVSNKQSLISYSEQIKSITFDKDRFDKVEAMRTNLNNVEALFKREGFPQYIRNAYIKDIAAMMNKMLLDFGFDSLLPVTVTPSGEFLYRGVKTRSISGAQKICTSIIQKFIYGRILSPSMKLGLMVLDEPSDGLDVSRREDLKSFLSALNKNLGLQLIIVTHTRDIIPEETNIIQL